MKKICSVILILIMLFSFVSAAYAADGVLDAPTIRVSNVSRTGKILVRWNVVEGAEKYEIYRAGSRSGEYKLLKTKFAKAENSFINTGAVAGKTYYYKVRALAKDGTPGEFSDIKYRTCDLAMPEPTVSITVKGYPKLTWDAVPGATGYRIYRTYDLAGEYRLMKTTEKTTYTNSNCVIGETYFYRVKAICGKSAADSAQSNVVKATAFSNTKITAPESVTAYYGETITIPVTVETSLEDCTVVCNPYGSKVDCGWVGDWDGDTIMLEIYGKSPGLGEIRISLEEERDRGTLATIKVYVDMRDERLFDIAAKYVCNNIREKNGISELHSGVSYLHIDRLRACRDFEYRYSDNQPYQKGGEFCCVIIIEYTIKDVIYNKPQKKKATYGVIYRSQSLECTYVGGNYIRYDTKQLVDLDVKPYNERYGYNV